MYRYVIKRLLLMIPVIIGVSFLVFFIMDMAPGDAVDVLAPEGATAEDLEAIRHDLGLDKPVVVRYIDYMAGMLHGDLGVSYISKTDVFQTYVEKLPATIKLSFASILISVILSVPLGIYSATRQGTIQDNISMAFAMIGLAMPHFWLGLLLVFSLSKVTLILTTKWWSLIFVTLKTSCALWLCTLCYHTSGISSGPSRKSAYSSWMRLGS